MKKTTVGDIAKKIESAAPLRFQESYDNSGMQVGHKEDEVKGILITLDITEEVLREAKDKGCNLVISHHPIIFGGLKKITGSNYVQKCVEYAIKNDINIYSAHTNLDKSNRGVSYKLAEKLGLRNIETLAPEEDKVYKIVTFVPESKTEDVAQAMYAAGAGTIGKYDQCSFRSQGTGTFRANEGCNPYCGQEGEYHKENENRLEIVVEEDYLRAATKALKNAHPYEEPAIDIFETKISHSKHGLGCIGELEEADTAENVLRNIKKTLGLGCIRHTNLPTRQIKRIALCGGAGHEFLRDAIRAKADMFLTSDIKYHQFFDAEDEIVIGDIGHYESEQFTKEIIFDVIYEKNANFAILYSENKTNPIKYL